MKNNQTSEGKILDHAHGLGTPTPAMMEARAREIAVINGRDENQVTQNDRDQARKELTGVAEIETTDEDRSATSATRAWDPVPGTQGHKVPNQEADDEQVAAEKLTKEGVAEADHVRMVEATEKTRRDEQG
jgi:hypothetical protein